MAAFKALNRSEVALKGDLTIERGSRQLHFLLSDRLKRMHSSKEGFLGFRIIEATKHGLKAAVLLANLESTTEEEHNTDPVLDADGNIYRELSPYKLSKIDEETGVSILPFSKDVIEDEIKYLIGCKAITPHPIKKHFYTICLATEDKKWSAAKVYNTAAKVYGSAAKVYSKNTKLECKVHNMNKLDKKNKTLDSNIDSNVDRKCILNDKPLAQFVVIPKPLFCTTEMNNLIDDCNRQLAKVDWNKLDEQVKAQVEASKVYRVVDYDEVVFDGLDLPDDYYSAELLEFNRGKYINESMELLKIMLQSIKWKYTKGDLSDLQQLFIKHPSLAFEDVEKLLIHCAGDIDLGTGGTSKTWWGDKIGSLKQFLRYLPQIIVEYYRAENYVECFSKDEYYESVSLYGLIDVFCEIKENEQFKVYFPLLDYYIAKTEAQIEKELALQAA